MAYDLSNLSNVTNYLSQQRQNGAYVPTNGSMSMPSKGWDLWAGYNSGQTYNPQPLANNPVLTTPASTSAGSNSINIGNRPVQQPNPLQHQPPIRTAPAQINNTAPVRGQKGIQTNLGQRPVNSTPGMSGNQDQALPNIVNSLTSPAMVNKNWAYDTPGSLTWADDQYDRATQYWQDYANQVGMDWNTFNSGGGSQYGYNPGVRGYTGTNATPFYDSTFGINTDPRGSYFSGTSQAPGFNGFTRSGYEDQSWIK